MTAVTIAGYGDDLSVNGIRIGDLTPIEHESIENEKDTPTEELLA